jgi:hypothetical protein
MRATFHSAGADELTTVAVPARYSSRQGRQRDSIQARAPDYRVVYFATHGLVAGERLAEPSLPLTQANSATFLDRERSDAACRLGGALGLSDFVGQSAPQQKNHNDNYQYRAESPAIIMVRSAQIETTAAKKENQNNQE